MPHIQKITRAGRTRWQARYRAPDGKERSKLHDRKIDAERWLVEQSADVAHGAWVDPALGRTTFATWAERWRAGVHGLRPSTVHRLDGIVANHLLPRFGGWPLAAIAASDVKAMVADDVAAGRSTSSVRQHVVVLRRILDAAVVEGLLRRNPAAGVQTPTVTNRPMRFLDPGEVRLLAEAHPAHYRPLVFTAAYVGMRWGELAGLRLKRVDLLRRVIAVTEQLVEINSRISWGPPKTKAGVRTVTIPDALVEILAGHFATEAVGVSGLAFPTPSGTPMRRTNFQRVWRRAVQRAGLGGLVFHELRHAAAALAIAQGAHPLTVKTRLGHSSITVTMDRYGHMFPAQDAALAEALNVVLRGSLEADTERVRNDGGTVARLRRSDG